MSVNAPSTASPSSPPTEGPPRQRRKVTRTRAGCLTCRKRRKLCDMGKPDCAACQRLCMTCAWPVPKSYGIVERQGSISSNSNSADQRQDPSQTHHRAGQIIAEVQSPVTATTARDASMAPGLLSTALGTEGSAADGLLDLFASEHGEVNPFSDYTSYASTIRNDARQVPMNDTAFSFAGISSTLAGPSIRPSLLPSSINPTISQGPPPPTDNETPFNPDLFSFDDATLQLWAADCLPSMTGAQTHDPFDSLNDLLFNQPPHTTNQFALPPLISPTSQTNPALTNLSTTPSLPPVLPESVSPRNPSTQKSHSDILQHYSAHLSSLVSCSGPSHPNAFDAFTSLANSTMSSTTGQGLHLSILAWAGRHMVNQGKGKYEAISERLAGEAKDLLLERAGKVDGTGLEDKNELMTLFAGLLMFVQFKVCRGDVWGFNVFLDHLSRLTSLLFPAGSAVLEPNSIQFHFFENLVYHDVVSSSLFTRGPMMSTTTLEAYARPAIDSLHTLTGISLKGFCIMHQIAGLIRGKRKHQDGIWSDDDLADLVKESEGIEIELNKERGRLDYLIHARPHYAAHRFFHEAFRIACLLQLRVFVMGTPPSSLSIRYLVRRSLSLLEEMCAQNLPGFCSAHWVIFTTSICAAPDGQVSGQADERTRAGKLYDHTRKLAFLNIDRTRKIVEEIWTRNPRGTRVVDWLDVLAEYDWEIIFA